jgi:hypothetical protein
VATFAGTRPQVALFNPGRDTISDRLTSRILTSELTKRVPGVSVRTFAPLPRPAPTNADESAEVLPTLSPDDVDELANQLDCMIANIDPDDNSGILSGQDDDQSSYWQLVRGLSVRRAERRLPAVWLSPDDKVKARLDATGVADMVRVVPDPAVLVPRLFSTEILAKRLEYLQLMEWYPRGRQGLVVQVDEGLADAAPRLAALIQKIVEAEPALDVVVIEAERRHGGGALTAALEGVLPSRTFRVPAHASLEDIVATISAGAVFVGHSVSACAAAVAFGKPRVLLDLTADGRLEAQTEKGDGSIILARNPSELEEALASAVRGEALSRGTVDAMVRRWDECLDGIAQLATDSTYAGAGSTNDPPREHVAALESRLAALETAYEARGRRLATERLAFADLAWELRTEKGRAEEERARAEDDRGRAEEERSRAEDERSRAEDDRGRAEEERARAEDEQARLRDALQAERSGREAIEAELAALLATRTFRYTAKARGAYRALRRWS